MSDPAQLESTLAEVQAELGAPSVVIHNAVGGAFANFLELDPEVLNRNFQVNTMALLRLAQATAPAMIEAGRGAFICTGNTSAYRGVENFAGFAPTKAAQRILCESMARHLGPKGVHVAFVGIDAVIDVPWTRKRFRRQAGRLLLQALRTSPPSAGTWRTSPGRLGPSMR